MAFWKLAGLLVGIGAIAVPGIGALFIGGPLAAALGLSGAAATTVSGAATGALAGGLIGALLGLGVPEEDARIYEERIKEGGILIAIPSRTGDEARAMDILEDTGADQVRAITTTDATSTARRGTLREQEYDEGRAAYFSEVDTPRKKRKVA